MTLESIYFLSQIIAVVAIIGSLLFVGYQVQQSRKMERAAAQRELLYRVSDFTRHYAEIGPAVLNCFVDYEGAAGFNQGRFGAYVSEFIFITEAALNMRRDGFFTEGTWQGIEGGALAMLRTPGGAQWWEHGKRYIGSEIVDHLERRLGEIDPNTPDFLELIPYFKKGIAEAKAQAAENPAAEAGSRDGLHPN